MANSNKDTEILIGKCISGNASSSEITQLEKWKSESDSNLSTYNKTLQAWNKSNIRLPAEIIAKDKAEIQSEINKQLESRFHKSKRKVLFYKVAAILAIPISMALGWFILQHFDLNQQNDQFCEITSPKGNVSKCILPDGTEVWINTGSTIVYNINSFNQENRQVELNGEAYFQVTNNELKPFSVTTKFGSINVTGTEFNVKSYSESNRLETVLAEGSVELQINKYSKQAIKLKAGERATYESENNEVDIYNVDAEMFSSWRNGEIIFKDATLNDLIKELERIYDIKFYLDQEEIGNFRFRGMFSYNNNLIDALEKIKKTAQLEYYIENKEVKLTKQN